jgi:glycosyltransferase involved in cell wall biosynthesis
VFLVAGPPACVGSPSAAKALAKRAFGLDAYDREVLARAAGAGGAIRFLGVRLDVPRILAATDVLVFPASVPHFGRPLIEAAAMAKPAVASHLGPSPELVEDGVTGLLVPPGDPGALAAAVDGILADPARARAMGEEAHARARRLFDAGENARRTFDVYAEILP